MRRLVLIGLGILGLAGLARAQLSWPVPLAVGQNYSVNIQGTGAWNVALTASSGAAFTGTAQSTQGGPALQASFFNRPDVDSAELDLTDGTQLYSCLFTGRASLQNGALMGQTFYRATATGQFQNLNRPCEVRPIAAQVGPAPAPQPNPNPGPSPAPNPAPNLTASWPPKPGQTWALTVTGLPVWTLNFTKLDSDGDPEGTAAQSGASKPAFAFMLEDGRKVFQFGGSDGTYVCVFPANPSVSGATFNGGQTLRKATGAQDFVNFNRACTATLQGGSSGTGTPGTGTGGTGTTGTGTTGQTGTPAALSWPVLGSVGQTWAINITGVGQWTLAMTDVDKDNIVYGTTTGLDARDGYFEYDQKNDLLVMWLDGASDYYGCVIRKTGLQGTTLRGGAVRGLNNQSPQDLKVACTVTLQSTTASAPSNPGANPGAGSSGTGSNGLNWPAIGKVGQTWGISLPSVGSWTVTFSQLSDKGNPIGRASGTDTRVGYFQYFRDDDTNVLWLDGEKDYYGCAITKSGIQGNVITGKAFEGVGEEDANETGLSCTLTLQAQTLGVVRDFMDLMRPLPRLVARAGHSTL